MRMVLKMKTMIKKILCHLFFSWLLIMELATLLHFRRSIFGAFVIAFTRSMDLIDTSLSSAMLGIVGLLSIITMLLIWASIFICTIILLNRKWN